MMDLEPNTLSAYEGSMFGDSWRFLVPDLVCDVDYGLIWKIHLDLEAISVSSSEVHSVLEFLQRRRSEQAKILKPSKEVSFQLIETVHKQTRKLGMDMLRQQLLHDEYVQVLTKHGYYLEALRYARKNKVVISQPSMYLEAALFDNNLEHLAALLRFFSDYIPGFEKSSDHTRYYHIISAE